MQNRKEIEAAARIIIRDIQARGDEVIQDWTVNELLQKFGQIKGNGVPAYTLCARDFCWRIIKLAQGKLRLEQEVPEQMPLKGYEHLFDSYPMERDGEHIVVKIDDCTPEELEERADYYERQASGFLAHAEELRKYAAKMRSRNQKSG